MVPPSPQPPPTRTSTPASVGAQCGELEEVREGEEQDDEDEEFWRVLSSRALSLSRSLARTRARAVSLSGRDADFVVCLLRTL